MTRLDKYLADASLGTRKHVKKAIRSGIVTVNQKTATDEGMLIDETKDQIAFQGKIIPFQQEVFILMNKPVGYMCSTIDELYPSVLNLIPEELRKRTRIVGRLDQDTTGVLLLTDDGKLNNRLIHPRLAIEKEYQATLNHPVKQEDMDKILREGIVLDEGEEPIKPKEIKIISPETVSLVITQGKYHEIKRIFHRVGYEVIALTRVRLAFLTCGDLKPGEYRNLTENEIMKIRELTGVNRKEE